MNHIILVDDDPDDVYFFESARKECPVNSEITVFNDGDLLLNYLRQNDNINDGNQPLIFLDLNLPRLSGLDVLEKLKANGMVNKLAIVIYTTSQYEKDIERAYRRGAKSFITKPSSRSSLVGLLNTTLDYWFNCNTLPRNPIYE